MIDRQAQMLSDANRATQQNGGDSHIQGISSSFERMAREMSRFTRRLGARETDQEINRGMRLIQKFTRKMREFADVSASSLGEVRESLVELFQQDRPMRNFAWRSRMTFGRVNEGIDEINDNMDDAFGRNRILETRRWERETERSLNDVQEAAENMAEPLNETYDNMTSGKFAEAISELGSALQMGAIGDIRSGLSDGQASTIELGDEIRKQLKLTKGDWEKLYAGGMNDIRAMNEEFNNAFSDTDYFSAMNDLIAELGVKGKSALADLTPQLVKFKDTLVGFETQDFKVFVRIYADWGKDGKKLNQEIGDWLAQLEGKFNVSGADVSQMLADNYAKMFNWADGDINKYKQYAKDFVAIFTAAENNYMDGNALLDNLKSIRGMSPANAEYAEWANTFARVGLNITDVQDRLRKGDFQGVAKDMVTSIGSALKDNKLDDDQKAWLKENLNLDSGQLDEIQKNYGSFKDDLVQANKEIANSTGAMDKVIKNERKSWIERLKNWASTTEIYQTIQQWLVDLDMTPSGVIATLMTFTALAKLGKPLLTTFGKLFGFFGRATGLSKLMGPIANILEKIPGVGKLVRNVRDAREAKLEAQKINVHVECKCMCECNCGGSRNNRGNGDTNTPNGSERNNSRGSHMPDDENNRTSRSDRHGTRNPRNGPTIPSENSSPLQSGQNMPARSATHGTAEDSMQEYQRQQRANQARADAQSRSDSRQQPHIPEPDQSWERGRRRVRTPRTRMGVNARLTNMINFNDAGMDYEDSVGRTGHRRRSIKAAFKGMASRSRRSGISAGSNSLASRLAEAQRDPQMRERAMSIGERGVQSTRGTGKVGKALGGAGKLLKGGGKLLGKGLLKGAKLIPGLGLVAGAADMALGGFQGYADTNKNFDIKKGEKATKGQKAASTIGGIASSATFGLLDEKTVANWTYNTGTKIKKGLGDAWTSTKKGASEAWDSTKTKASEAWETTKTTWSTGKENLKTWWGETKGKASESWDSAKTKAGEAWTNVSTTWSAGKESLKTWWGETQTKAGESWDSAKTKAGEAWTGISTTWTTGKETLKTWWGETQTKAVEAWDSAKTKGSEAWTGISTTWSTGKETLKTWWGETKTKAGESWNHAKTKASEAWNTTSSKWSSGKESLKTWFGEVKTKASSAWSSAKEGASNAWSTASSKWGDGKEKLKGWFGEVKTKGSELWSSVKTKAPEAASAAKNAFETFGSKSKTAISGIATKVGDIASAAWDAAKALGSMITKAGDKLLQKGKQLISGKGGGHDTFGSGAVGGGHDVKGSGAHAGFGAGKGKAMGGGFRQASSYGASRSMGGGFTKTSSYGYRSDPFTKQKKMHRGVDYAAPKGTPVGSSSDGTVVHAKWGVSGSGYNGYGNAVAVKDSKGRIRLYGHLSSMNVKAGQKVKQGQLIGKVGSTGHSTGNHLHYEVRKGGYGSDINPMPYVNNSIFHPGASKAADPKTKTNSKPTKAEQKITTNYKDTNANRYKDLRKVPSIGASSLNKWLNKKTRKGSLMRDKGEAFAKASKDAKLDPIYLVAHAAHETGWGTSNIVKKKGNYYGIGAFDATPYSSAYKYKADAGIVEGAKWIRKHYADRGQYSLYKMRHNGGKHQYATDPKWDTKIAAIMAGSNFSGTYTVAPTSGTAGTSTSTEKKEEPLYTSANNSSYYKGMKPKSFGIGESSGTATQRSAFGSNAAFKDGNMLKGVGGGSDIMGAGAPDENTSPTTTSKAVRKSTISNEISNLKRYTGSTAAEVSESKVMKEINVKMNAQKAKPHTTHVNNNNGDVVDVIKWLAMRLEGKLDEVSAKTDENTAWINKYKKSQGGKNPYGNFA